MIPRHISKLIDYSLDHFPCTILTGPRQVGKTTLLDKVYVPKGYSFISLDNSSDRLLAQNDPKSFLELHPYPLIIDEAQKAPELFPELERIINEKRRLSGSNNANGLYILSGSNRKELLEEAKESLAGRASIINMSPFSVSELYFRDNQPFIPDIAQLSKNVSKGLLNQDQILELIVKGELPQLYDDDNLQSSLFYSSYITTYMEKDIRELINLKDELKFHNLLTLVVSLTGQELVYENIAKEIGVSANTIKQWISVMAKTGIIYLLQPYYENSIKKRIVKRPKIYFFDTGLACYLLGIDSKETLSNSFLKGRLFETFVFNEILKSYSNSGEDIKLYYYRDSNQKEVDFVLIKNGTIHCMECKFGQEHSLRDVSNFRELKDSQFIKGKGAIICTSTEISALSSDVLVIPASII